MVQHALVHQPLTQEREFIAAVRLLDGRRELYRIPNALDAEDARQVVLNQLFEVANVVVSQRH